MAQTLDREQTYPKHSPSERSFSLLWAVVPKASCLLAALIASIVLLGWASHEDALVTVLPNLPAMAQSTAVAFLFASAALWLLGRSSPGSLSHRAGRALGIAALLFGLGTLLRYGLSPSGHAPLIGHAPLPPGGANHPTNRMSPNSAINFVLLGLALFLTDARGRGDRWPAQALGLIVALDALVALVGQLYGITSLYGLSPYLGMAVHTALLFLLLSLGMLLARPDRGFVAVALAEDAAGRAARRFLPLALAAPLVLGGVSLLGERLHRPDAPFLAYLLVVASVGLLGWLVWGNVLALSAQLRRSQSYERQVADLERGRVEEALAASEQRLLFAVEGAGIGTWSWDIAGNHLVWSPHCKALFGLPPETEMTRALFFERIHPDDRPNAEATIARSLAEGSAYDIEYRVVWPDGAVHWVAAKGRGYRDDAGRPERFEGTVQDIDGRKAAEATLREAAERQKALLRDVLASVTGGRLRLMEAEEDLPSPLSEGGGPIPLTAADGLRALRQQVRETTLALGFADERWQDLVTAASEGGMNAVTHGGGLGEARVSSDGVDTVQVWVQDWGGGINMQDLPRATLSRGWSSTASLGHGLVMILQSVDRVWLLTGPEGTVVVMEQSREEPLPAWL